MQPDTELLNSIYQNAKMGEEALKSVIKNVDNDNIKSDIQKQMAGYSELSAKARQKLAEQHREPEELSAMAKASAYVGTQINTLMDHTPSHIAEMLIQGSMTDVIDMTENIHRYSNASPSVKGLAKQAVDFENRNIEELKSYL